MTEPKRSLEAQLRTYGELLDRHADAPVAPRHLSRSFASQQRPASFARRHTGVLAVACGVAGLLGAVLTFANRQTSTVRTAASPSTGARAVPTTANSPTTTAVWSDTTVRTTATSVAETPPIGDDSIATTAQTVERSTTTTAGTQTPPTIPSTTALASTVASTTAITVAPTTTSAALATTTPTTTTAPATSTTTTTTMPSLAKQAAGRLPHLQLNVTAFQFNRPSHTLTSRIIGSRTDAAVTSSWDANGRHAYLVVANVSMRFAISRPVTIRRKQANVAVSIDRIEIRWIETDGVMVQLTTSGMTESEAVALADGIISVADEPWTAIVNRSTVTPAPTPWESVLTDNTF